MKAMLCKAWGPPESLVYEDVPSQEPGPGMVKIGVRAAGMNFPDTLLIEGKYQMKPPFPFAPGAEVAGIVMSVGTGVTRFKAGDKVMATSSTGAGAYAEEMITAEASVQTVPDGMTWEQAAGFAAVYGTSYHALVQRAHIKAGETLLVLGAAGGVGLAAVELGKAMGATVIGAVGADEKFAVVRDHGADHVINYTTASLKDQVKALTQDRGADVIYDAVGGDMFDQSMRCIAWEGRLLVVGFASGRIPQLPANLALLKGCQVVGVFYGAFAAREPETAHANFAAMAKLFAAGKLRPHVSKTFPLKDAAHAMRQLLTRKYPGKLVLTMGAA